MLAKCSFRPDVPRGETADPRETVPNLLRILTIYQGDESPSKFWRPLAMSRQSPNAHGIDERH